MKTKEEMPRVFRTKEEITEITDKLYQIAVRHWQPDMGQEVLVKGGIVLGIAHEEETRIKSLQSELFTLKQVVLEMAGELGFYADKERPPVEKGGRRARECLEKYKDVIEGLK